MQTIREIIVRCWVGIAIAGLISATPSSKAQTIGSTMDQSEAQAQKTWRETIRTIPPPAEGCYQASYPDPVWTKVNCVQAPHPTRVLKNGMTPNVSPLTNTPQTINGHNDYFLNTTGTISQAIGSFPTVQGVTSETGNTGGQSVPNWYLLQLNTNTSSAPPACENYTGCFSWQQFMLSSNYVPQDSSQPVGESEVFIQQWLENYGDSSNGCPNGWEQDGQYPGGPGWECFKNSGATVVSNSPIPITNLASLQLTGNASINGTDTAIVTYGSNAYSSSTPDSNTGIANSWNQAEFNVLGNYEGSEATFNTGSSITVNLAIQEDGNTSMPTCKQGSSWWATTESNSLNLLSSCTVSGGSMPSIQFTESN